MQAPDPLTRLREAAVAAFQPAIDPNAPGLVTVLRRSVEYGVVDQQRSQIVVDRRALLLATVAIGSDTAEQYANMATWFAAWLEQRLPSLDLPSVCADARTSEEALHGADGNGFTLVLSESVRSARDRAVDFARKTVSRDKISLRHLFFALLEQPNHNLEIKEFGWSATETDLADLRKLMFERIGSDPESSESMEAWQSLLGQESAAPASPAAPMPHHGPKGLEGEEGGPGPGGTGGATGGAGTGTPPPPSPAYFVSGFSADRTTDHDSDPLDTEADVLAMARLICHEDADPPISIGVFGGWGSGKSSFMEALQWEVAALTDKEVKGSHPQEGPRFVSPVVQIRFNAWQFADADLWTSLTAEFFDQLRAGGFEGGGKRIHAQLVEKVNEHVRGLGKEAAERRAAQSLADEELRTAQAEQAEAVRQKDNDVRQALVSGLAEAFERNRAELARVGLVDSRSSDQVAQFIKVAKDVRTLSGQIKRILIMLLRHWPLLLATALILAALTWAAVKLTGKDLAGAITAVIGGGAVLLPLIRGSLKAIESVVRETAPFADSIEQAETKGLKAVLDSEVKVRLAREESEALRAAAERADRALARYVDPNATANPPRVLRYLLEDDPDTKAFEKEIGLLGRARRLFQALDQIVADNRLKKQKAEAADSSTKEDAGPPDPDIPDRIVLYIDDLDRCTHEQVYKVLQAVHLLLAFELFVVVVAVDVAWIEAALAKSIEFAGAETDDDAMKEAARRRRAIEYLSKIFQLPFWLKPFSGKDDTRYANYVRSLTRVAAASESGAEPDKEGTESGGTPPPPPPPPTDRAGDGEDARDEDTGADDGGGEGIEQGGEPGGEGSGADGEVEGAEDGSASEPDPDEVARALRTLQLTRGEEDFLASAEIAALAAADPRGVKRLVNVYKIVRSRLSETDDAMILGGNGVPPAFPLIALCAAIETGQPFEVADNFYVSLKSHEGTLGELEVSEPIKSAITRAVELRGGLDEMAEDALEIARAVRRYSFNRFH